MLVRTAMPVRHDIAPARELGRRKWRVRAPREALDY